MLINEQIDNKIKARLAELSVDDEEKQAKFLSDKTGLPYIDLRIKSPEPDALKLVDESYANKYAIAPFKYINNDLHIAIVNPNDSASIDYLKKLKDDGLRLVLYICSPMSWKKVMNRYKDVTVTKVTNKGLIDLSGDNLNKLIEDVSKIEDFQNKIHLIEQNDNREKISKLIEMTLAGAIHFKVSDIHIEPEEDKVRFRYRIDGNLQDIFYTDKPVYNLILSRLKLISGLKLSTTQNAQDGRFSMNTSVGEIEMRVSLVPGSYGESFVMRLLDPRNANVSFDSLGMSQIIRDELDKALRKPFGMILTTGPTGSGKSTTLYSCLRKAYNSEIKIITIEDPIEYHLEGITQTQVELGKGYTFLSGLRAALRQDPDIILVGEIRDEDTANVSAQAALTGHIVLSTLHTNTAAGAIPRFINLGVDAKTLGSSLSFVMAQRLCRKLCDNCKIKTTSSDKESKIITNTLGNMLTVGKPVEGNIVKDVYDIYIANKNGCDKCHGGYKGRIGIFEGLVMNKEIEDVAIKSGSERDIAYVAEKQGIPNMTEDAVLKILKGLTDFDEASKEVELL